jgi:hypothetical protein
MTLSSRFTIACVLALTPFAMAFAAPANVTGIQGSVRDGKAHVTWQQPAGTQPASYRLFYSRLSILQQNGLYDDFETVPGDTTEYTFASLPYVTDKLFVSVLAVDANGEESPLFMEEARIDLNGAAAVSSTPTAQASSAAQSTQMVSGTQQMLSAQADSATGVLITFSLDVQMDTRLAVDAFNIKDASGSVLRITKLVIQGKDVLLHTVPQQKGKVYRLHVSNIVKGTNAQGAVAELAADQNDILFMGHETGSTTGASSSAKAAVSSVASSAGQSSVASMPTEVGDVRSLNVRGQRQGNAYGIDVSWLPPSTQNIREYRISQTRDGGKTFDTPRTVPATTLGLKINGVPAGDYGILVQAVATDGTVSRGVMGTLRLPAITGGSNLGGSVIGDGKGKGKGKGLSDTGIATTLPILLSGAAAGWQLTRRKGMRSK